jgi:hypothetical protein
MRLAKRTRQRSIDLARRRIEQLEQAVERMNAEQQQAVRRQLERAEELAATDRDAAESPSGRGSSRSIATRLGPPTWWHEAESRLKAQ